MSRNQETGKIIAMSICAIVFLAIAVSIIHDAPIRNQVLRNKRLMYQTDDEFTEISKQLEKIGPGTEQTRSLQLELHKKLDDGFHIMIDLVRENAKLMNDAWFPSCFNFDGSMKRR